MLLLSAGKPSSNPLVKFGLNGGVSLSTLEASPLLSSSNGSVAFGIILEYVLPPLTDFSNSLLEILGVFADTFGVEGTERDLEGILRVVVVDVDASLFCGAFLAAACFCNLNQRLADILGGGTRTSPASVNADVVRLSGAVGATKVF